MRWHHFGSPDRPQRLHRWQASSHKARAEPGIFVSRTIAGKPASALTVQILWELACQRLGRLPQVLRCSQNQDLAGIIMWERACLRWHHFGSPDRPQRLHRWQASSHKARAEPGIFVSKTIAGKPAPTLTVQILWELACQRLGRLSLRAKSHPIKDSPPPALPAQPARGWLSHNAPGFSDLLHDAVHDHENPVASTCPFYPSHG